MIYSLVQIGLFSCDMSVLTELSEEQWQDIYKELKEQTIIGIPVETVFASIMLPDKLQKKWLDSYVQGVSYYYQLLYEQNELVKLMSQHNIPMVLLKGTAAAMYYPNPSARMMGDIDFLVPEKDFQRAYHLMLENGYELKYDEDHVDYHVSLQKNRFLYEIHREPAGMPTGDVKQYLQRVLDEGMNAIRMVPLDDYTIPVLPGMQNGVVLLLHIVKHLKKGLGLRQIIDWMMYVNKELHDDAWYGQMQPVLQKAGFETLAKAVTRMCQIYLGLPQDGITWCLDADESVCDKLMEYIMHQGNFGRKAKGDNGIKIVEEIHNPFEALALMQRRGEKYWTFLGHHSWARPFAWAYMGCRYIRKGLQRKSPVKMLVNDIQEGNERKWLFEQLDFLKNVKK